MNTPNKITVGRIILVPVFMVLLYLDLPYWALAVYIIACVSDLVDGRIARKYNLVTDFGKFMDPLAIKCSCCRQCAISSRSDLCPDGWLR